MRGSGLRRNDFALTGMTLALTERRWLAGIVDTIILLSFVRPSSHDQSSSNRVEIFRRMNLVRPVVRFNSRIQQVATAKGSNIGSIAIAM